MWHRALIVLVFMLGAGRAGAEELTLLDEKGKLGEFVLETLLFPGEFPDRVLVYVSKGDDAAFALDLSLGSKEPFAELHPSRLSWPKAAGLEIVIEGEPLRLTPASADVNDTVLDEGFDVRWVLRPLGQRFDGMPRFAMKVVAALVIAQKNGKPLLIWKEKPAPSICRKAPKPGEPSCDLFGVGLETAGLSLSPDGNLAAIALGGLKPRMEVYDISDTPALLWQALFPAAGGQVVETAFSADGDWVVALTSLGEMHRFDSKKGQNHLSIPSKGRAARSISPGEIIAVGGAGGEVTFWYLSDGTIFWRLPSRNVRGPVDKLAASGNGERFATLEYDETKTVVRVWEINERSMLAELAVDPYAIEDIALSRDGKQLYVTHEKGGLLTAQVAKNAVLAEQSQDTSRCTGRLQWMTEVDLLSCSTSLGELRLDFKGRIKGEHLTGIEASSWIFSASSNGKRLAAVGGGHLLTWWTE